MMIPTLFCYHEKTDGNGNKVYGHKTRCRRLMQAHSGRSSFVSEEMLPHIPKKKSVLIIDSWRAWDINADHPFIVSIVDAPFALPHPDSVAIINSSFGAGAEKYFKFYQEEFKEAVPLTGPQWFFNEQNIEKVRLAIARRKKMGWVAIAPGGNKKRFWEQVDLDDVAAVAANFGLNIKVLHGMQPKTFLTNLGLSHAVICPASVTSMEALYLGCKILPVLTSDDQLINFEHYLNNKISAYSSASLHMLLSNQAPDQRWLGKTIPENGAKNTLDFITFMFFQLQANKEKNGQG